MITIKVVYNGKTINLGKKFASMQQIMTQAQNRFKSIFEERIVLCFEGKIIESYDQIVKITSQTNVNHIKLQLNSSSKTNQDTKMKQQKTQQKNDILETNPKQEEKKQVNKQKQENVSGSGNELQSKIQNDKGNLIQELELEKIEEVQSDLKVQQNVQPSVEIKEKVDQNSKEEKFQKIKQTQKIEQNHQQDKIDELNSWKSAEGNLSKINQTRITYYTCFKCNGEGKFKQTITCPNCDGQGKFSEFHPYIDFLDTIIKDRVRKQLESNNEELSRLKQQKRLICAKLDSKLQKQQKIPFITSVINNSKKQSDKQQYKVQNDKIEAEQEEFKVQVSKKEQDKIQLPQIEQPKIKQQKIEQQKIEQDKKQKEIIEKKNLPVSQIKSQIDQKNLPKSQIKSQVQQKSLIFVEESKFTLLDQLKKNLPFKCNIKCLNTQILQELTVQAPAILRFEVTNTGQQDWPDFVQLTHLNGESTQLIEKIQKKQKRVVNIGPLIKNKQGKYNEQFAIIHHFQDQFNQIGEKIIVPVTVISGVKKNFESKIVQLKNQLKINSNVPDILKNLQFLGVTYETTFGQDDEFLKDMIRNLNQK